MKIITWVVLALLYSKVTAKNRRQRQDMADDIMFGDWKKKKY